MQFAGITDIGNKRARNEDAIRLDGDHGLFLVADGMGGLPDGDQASRLAIDETHGFVTSKLTPALSGEETAELLARALRLANDLLYGKKGGQSGSTCLAVRVQKEPSGENKLAFAHVGDCRLLLFSKGKLTQLNREHSLVRRLIDDGHLTEEEARSHSYRNVVEQAVGIAAELSPESGVVPLQEGDRLLLCSDGLWSELSNEEIATLLGRWLKTQTCCEQLVEAAKAHGGNDNISIILIDC